MDIIIQGGPTSRKSKVQEGIEGRKRKIMQPFAMSPTKKSNVGRTTLDACLHVPKNKMKPVRCLAEEKRKAIFKVKNKYMKGKGRKSHRLRQVEEGGCTLPDSSSNDVEDTSNDEG